MQKAKEWAAQTGHFNFFGLHFQNISLKGFGVSRIFTVQ